MFKVHIVFCYLNNYTRFSNRDLNSNFSRDNAIHSATIITSFTNVAYAFHVIRETLFGWCMEPNKTWKIHILFLS